jgi:hypothetical protein
MRDQQFIIYIYILPPPQCCLVSVYSPQSTEHDEQIESHNYNHYLANMELSP